MIVAWGSVADWASAAGTFSAAVVSLWIALRSERIRYRVFAIDVASLGDTDGGSRLDIYVLNRGDRPLLLERLGVRANGQLRFIQAYAGMKPLPFAETQIVQLTWNHLKLAVDQMASTPRWRWVLLKRLPKPVSLVISLTSGERMEAPIPASTIARLLGRKRDARTMPMASIGE